VHKHALAFPASSRTLLRNAPTSVPLFGDSKQQNREKRREARSYPIPSGSRASAGPGLQEASGSWTLRLSIRSLGADGPPTAGSPPCSPKTAPVSSGGFGPRPIPALDKQTYAPVYLRPQDVLSHRSKKRTRVWDSAILLDQACRGDASERTLNRHRALLAAAQDSGRGEPDANPRGARA